MCYFKLCCHLHTNKTSYEIERFLEIVFSTLITKGTISAAAAYYISLICPTRSWMTMQVRIHFDLLLLFSMFLSKDTATAVRIHLWLHLCTNVISGWFLSKRLLIKIIISHMRFTCSYLMINGSECSYHFCAHLRPYFLHSSQSILKGTLSQCHFYSFCANWVHSLTIHLVALLNSLHKGKSAFRVLERICSLFLLFYCKDYLFGFLLQESFSKPRSWFLLDFLCFW